MLESHVPSTGFQVSSTCGIGYNESSLRHRSARQPPRKRGKWNSTPVWWIKICSWSGILCTHRNPLLPACVCGNARTCCSLCVRLVPATVCLGTSGKYDGFMFSSTENQPKAECCVTTLVIFEITQHPVARKQVTGSHRLLIFLSCYVCPHTAPRVSASGQVHVSLSSGVGKIFWENLVGLRWSLEEGTLHTPIAIQNMVFICSKFPCLSEYRAAHHQYHAWNTPCLKYANSRKCPKMWSSFTTSIGASRTHSYMSETKGLLQQANYCFMYTAQYAHIWFLGDIVYKRVVCGVSSLFISPLFSIMPDHVSLVR